VPTHDGYVEPLTVIRPAPPQSTYGRRDVLHRYRIARRQKTNEKKYPPHRSQQAFADSDPGPDRPGRLRPCRSLTSVISIMCFSFALLKRPAPST